MYSKQVSAHISIQVYTGRKWKIAFSAPDGCVFERAVCFSVFWPVILTAAVGNYQVRNVLQHASDHRPLLDVDMKSFSLKFHPTATRLLRYPTVYYILLDCTCSTFVTKVYFFIKRLHILVASKAFRLYNWYMHCLLISNWSDPNPEPHSLAVKITPYLYS